jgi:hypothetical protein
MRNCPCWKLDDLTAQFGPPGLLKIDVEGAENLVLEGAARTLEDFRPVILCECSGGKTGESSAELLRASGYVWRPWNSKSAFDDTTIPNSDIVAVPRELIGSLAV